MEFRKWSLLESHLVWFNDLDSHPKDYFMKAAQVGFLVAAMLHIPMTLFPSREQIYTYYKLSKHTGRHILLTTIMTFIAFIVPCIYPNVTSIFSLIGGITVGSSGYLLPVILKITSLKDRPITNPYKLGHVVLGLMILVIQVTSVYASITAK